MVSLRVVVFVVHHFNLSQVATKNDLHQEPVLSDVADVGGRRVERGIDGHVAVLVQFAASLPARMTRSESRPCARSGQTQVFGTTLNGRLVSAERGGDGCVRLSRRNKAPNSSIDLESLRPSSPHASPLQKRSDSPQRKAKTLGNLRSGLPLGSPRSH